eukprot:symbB.v1.2.041478.t1/scaffold8258.1/size7065/1
MIARLSDVLAPHLGLVKDKMAMVVKVDLHHEDQERLRHREAGFCHFVPEYMAKGVLVDLRRAGGLEDDDWWLAIYVMLTRARKLENLILLGVTEQVEDLLRRGPPSYLRELTGKLEAKAAATLERLQNWPVYDSLQTS